MTEQTPRTVAERQVALLGIVVAGAVTVAIGQGAWDIYDSITGVVLLVVLLGWMRSSPPSLVVSESPLPPQLH
jgi:hypothetical protein